MGGSTLVGTDSVRQPALFQGLRTPKQIFRDLRNYLAGQFLGATRDDALLDEVLKCLFCKLYLETAAEGKHRADTEACQTTLSYRRVFQAVRDQFPEIYAPTDDLLLDTPTLTHVLRALDFSLLESLETDPIGDAFEVFAGSESRGRSGQFFTPRNATDLLVEAVDPRPGEKIIDPACGAGGFLASVARHLRKAGHSRERVAVASQYLFGIDKDSYLARLARVHISLLTNGHPPVFCGDSLAFHTGKTALSELMPFSEEYDVVLTNPPFGAKIVAALPPILATFSLARQWRPNGTTGTLQPTTKLRHRVPPQVLFIERSLSLLRPGGRLGIVLPESVLSNKTYRYVAEYLRTNARIDAVIGMPESLFKTSGKGGTHTKTCLVVAVKRKAASRRRSHIFMAEARWCGKDSRSREVARDDLPQIRQHLADFLQQRVFPTSRQGFVVHRKEIVNSILCPRYYDPELREEINGLRSTHRLITVGSLVDRTVLAIKTGDEVGALAYGSGDIPFVRTSDLSNWEIKINPKHCIASSLYESLRQKQDVQTNDILMVKDGTYLVGTCALVTEYDRRIVYQSHLYKIRVLKDVYGLNPFLLLAILSSHIVQRQVRSMRFTQDIIDSLGERIKDLILPVPRDPSVCGEVSCMVERVIRERIEARELSRRATLAVLGGARSEERSASAQSG